MLTMAKVPDLIADLQISSIRSLYQPSRTLDLPEMFSMSVFKMVSNRPMVRLLSAARSEQL